eukprot:g28048.t1
MSDFDTGPLVKQKQERRKNLRQGQRHVRETVTANTAGDPRASAQRFSAAKLAAQERRESLQKRIREMKQPDSECGTQVAVKLLSISSHVCQDKEGTEMARWVRKASLITVVFQNTALALCMRYSRLPREAPWKGLPSLQLEVSLMKFFPREGAERRAFAGLAEGVRLVTGPMKDINSWSLTFKQPTVEESFLASRRAGLIRAIFWSCLVLVPLTLVNVYYALVSWCLVIFMPGVVFFDWHYMVKLYNVDEIHLMLEDQQCYKYASDTRLMLTWIALSTSSHFFLNLRWFMLLPCEVSGIFSYGFCALLGSPEGIFNLPMNLALFTGITVLASMAKRQLEHHERKSMLQLISERIKRCDSEFKVLFWGTCQVFSGDRSVGFQTCVTRFTQALFDVKSNCREQLAEMMKLGRQEHWLIEAGQLQFDPKELIGRGNYGVILAGDLLGMSVAVKLPLANASLSLPDLANELRFLRRVRHPHIVAFQGACILPDAEMLFLVEELVRGTSLQALMNGKLVLNPREKHGVLLGICRHSVVSSAPT